MFDDCIFFSVAWIEVLMSFTFEHEFEVPIFLFDEFQSRGPRIA